MNEYAGIFKRKYGRLQGKAWVREIEPEDRQVLVQIGLQAADYGRLGGKARAEQAVRDERGHFSRPDGTNKDTDLRRILGPAYDTYRADAVNENLIFDDRWGG